MATNGPTQPSDGLSPAEYQRLLTWMADPERVPASLAFTSGVLRDCATAFEGAIKILANEFLVNRNETLFSHSWFDKATGLQAARDLINILNQRIKQIEAQEIDQFEA